MGDSAGEADNGALKLDFDRRLLLQFRGSSITSDAGLLAYRELDDTLDLTNTGAETLADARTGKNGRHRLAGDRAIAGSAASASQMGRFETKWLCCRACRSSRPVDRQGTPAATAEDD